MKKSRNIILISIIMIIIAMSIGYSIFETKLILNHTAEIAGEWKIRIIDAEVDFVTNGCDPGIPEYTDTTVTLNSKLVKPGDFITYKLTIKNEGTIEANLENVIFMQNKNGSPAINYKTSNLEYILKFGEETELFITVEYDSSYTIQPEIKTQTLIGIIEYIQK